MNRIGLVTVTYNSADVLANFLMCVRSQDYSDWRLYVVDNASKDDSLEIVRREAWQDQRVQILANSENRGIAAGNNQGILAALADGCHRVLLINNDVEFAPDLMSSMAASMSRLLADMLVPKIRYFDPPDMIWCAGGKFLPQHGYVRTKHFGDREIDAGQFDAERRIEYAPTCCILVAASVFQRIGLMDEKFFVYCDDTDFCYRAGKAHSRFWYVPKPVLYHKVSSLTGAGSDFSRFHILRGRVYFIRKHLPVLKRLLLPLLQIEIFLRFVWRLFSGKFPGHRFLLEQRAFFDGMRIPVGAE